MIRLVTVALVATAISSAAALAAAGDSTRGDPPQRRTRITVYPRTVQPGPNAQRYCTAWLQRENRVSGPVVTPQMRCEWR